MAEPSKINLPDNIIQNEYKHHKTDTRFPRAEAFRQYIHDTTSDLVSNTAIHGNKKIIKYVDLYRHKSSSVCGIFEKDKLKWKLTKFITESQLKKNQKRNKQKKSKRKGKVKPCGLSYDPKEDVKSTIKIQKQLTQIRNRVNTDISDIYHYIIKSVALSDIVIANDGKTRVFNFQLVDKNTGECLYCIADKDVNKSSSYEWIMRDEVYTAAEIGKLIKLNKNKLPINVRDSDDYKQKLRDVVTMQHMLNDPNTQAELFNVKVTWQNIDVFTNNKAANKAEFKLTKPKDIFVEDCKTILKNKNIAMIPILLFNHNTNHYTIHGLIRIRIEGNDIGISFKFNNGKILPGSVHLEQSRVKLMHQLATPNSCQNAFFDHWEITINNIFIGDNDYYLNKFRSKSIECQRKTDILVDILVELDKYDIEDKCKTLVRLIKKAKSLTPSLDNCDKISVVNDDIKQDAPTSNDSNNIYGTMVFYPNVGTPVITSGMMVPVTPVQTPHNSVQYSSLSANAAEFVPETKGLITIDENAQMSMSNCVL